MNGANTSCAMTMDDLAESIEPKIIPTETTLEDTRQKASVRNIQKLILEGKMEFD